MYRRRALFLLVSLAFVASLFAVDADVPVWGALRPGLHTGLRTRLDHPGLLAGLFYYPLDRVNSEIRGSCKNGDKYIKHFGWVRHDGRKYGVHEVLDTDANLNLTTSVLFASAGESDKWSLRVSGAKLDPTKPSKSVAVVVHFGVEAPQFKEKVLPRKFDPQLEFENQGKRKHSTKGLSLPVVLHGSSPHYGSFQLTFPADSDGRKNTHPMVSKADRARVKGLKIASTSNVHTALVNSSAPWNGEGQLSGLLEQRREKVYKAALRTGLDGEHPIPGTAMTLPNTREAGANSALVSRMLKVPFEFEVLFLGDRRDPSAATAGTDDGAPAYGDADAATGAAVTASGAALLAGRSQSPSGSALTSILGRKRAFFDAKFEDVFNLSARLQNLETSYSTDSLIEFGSRLLSNLLGGMGYFRGHSVINSETDQGIVRGEHHHLFAATPSRSFFPRGFLWDDGFHHLVTGKWIPEIAMEAVHSWLGAMVHKPEQHAGWIPREQILGQEALSTAQREFVPQPVSHANPPTILLPALAASKSSMSQQRYVKHLRQMLPLFDRHLDWMKFSQQSDEEYSYRWRGRAGVHTLSSGLDDYPRAPDASNVSAERHLDLYCWLVHAHSAMASMSLLAGARGLAHDYTMYARDLGSQLDDKFWCQECNKGRGRYADYHGQTELVRRRPLGNGQFREEVVPILPFSDHDGYIAYFPLILRLLTEEQGERFDHLMEDLTRPGGLISPFGLRSMAVDDPFFQKGDNYWTGKIWLPINYLFLGAMEHYKVLFGPESSRGRLCAEVAASLRNGLVNNMFKVYQSTGYVWENYDPLTGEGKGARAFTGWSSLVLLIMSEEYI